MTKVEVAKTVAERLFAAEESIDAATVRASQLLEAMIDGRRALNLSAPSAELAQARTSEAMAALAEARRAVVAAHTALAGLQRKLDISDTEFGPVNKPEEESGTKTITNKAVRLVSA